MQMYVFCLGSPFIGFGSYKGLTSLTVDRPLGR